MSGSLVKIHKTMMSDGKRPYRMKARAAAQERTRLRITESAVALHGTIGPSRTSMSAVADHAGVRRSTLYRHFPDESALFSACSAHWAAQNPLPDVDAWAAVGDPAERLERALTELYTYYASVEQMLANLIRDAETTPAMQQEFGQFRRYFAVAQDVLVAGRRLRGRAGTRTRAGIGHALAFGTWRSLVREQGLREADAVEFMCRAVTASAQPAPRAPAARSSTK
jgi:AcrR family transcriptional regulator